MAMFRRKWPIHSWITGVIIGIFFVGLATSIALAADAAPKVRDRYNAIHRSTIRTLQPFSTVDFAVGEGVTVDYRQSSAYSVTLDYVGNPDLSAIKTSVDNGHLNINDQSLGYGKHCNMLCLFPTYNMKITVNSPKPGAIDNAPKPFEIGPVPPAYR
jgi:hypothetical protein